MTAVCPAGLLQKHDHDLVGVKYGTATPGTQNATATLMTSKPKHPRLLAFNNGSGFTQSLIRINLGCVSMHTTA